MKCVMGGNGRLRYGRGILALFIFAVMLFSLPGSVFAQKHENLSSAELREYLFERDLSDEELSEAINGLTLEQLASLEALLSDEESDKMEEFLDNDGYDVPALKPSGKAEPFVQTVPGQDIVWPQEGAINLSKTAQKLDGLENKWRVTLQIDGKNKYTTTDIVLVIDSSNSMNRDLSGNSTSSDSKRRITYTRSAAKKFAQSIFNGPNKDRSRIAVVSFGETAVVRTEFTSSLSQVETAINNINVNGGTNIQAGFYQARLLLQASNADNKAVIVLGDGEPTFSYKITGASGISYTCRNRYGYHSYEVTYDNPKILSVDYTKVVGSGNGYNISNQEHRYSTVCTHGNTIYTTFPANNGIPAIYEANLVKGSGASIYSIAFGAGSTGENVLKNCASDPVDTYRNISSGTSETDIQNILNEVFAYFAAKIAKAATDSSVIDPVGDMFELVAPNGITDITVSQGTVQINTDSEGKEILNWNIGDISEGIPAIMSYVVSIRSEAQSGVNYPTNKTTPFNYTNCYGEQSVKQFPIPEVGINSGNILIYRYLVNGSGEPVNINGEKVDSPLLAHQLSVPEYFVYEGSSDLAVPNTYEVDAPFCEGYKCHVVSLDLGDIAYTNSVSVLLNGTLCNRTVYFGYLAAQQGSLTITKSGSQSNLQTFIFEITTPRGEKLYEALPGNSSRKITDLAFGQYTVREITEWSHRYTTVTNSVSEGTSARVEIGLSNEDAQVTFYNTLEYSKWLSAENYALNSFKQVGGEVVNNE